MLQWPRRQVWIWEVGAQKQVDRSRHQGSLTGSDGRRGDRWSLGWTGEAVDQMYTAAAVVVVVVVAGGVVDWR